jgi:methyl-accepting chemotaxis protein
MDDVGNGLDESLRLTSQSLDTVGQTISVTRTTLDQVHQGLVTVQETADNVGATISETRPLLDQVSAVSTEDVPNSLEQVQETIPDLVQVARAIDDTLTTLNRFQFQRSIDIPIRIPGLFEQNFSIPFEFDLGLDYNPAAPFDESVAQIGESLEGVPDRLRALEANIDVADENMLAVSQNLHDVADDLETINATVEEFGPLLDEYAAIVTDTTDRIRLARVSVQRTITSIKNTLTVIFIWFALTQLAPLYLGYELAAGKRNAAVAIVDES